MNASTQPFDDILVRKAFNYAVDRETLVKVVERGHAVVQYGPISPATTGYWPGVEYIGYGYDPDKARALLEEAGYAIGSDGFFEKDGERFELVLKFPPNYVQGAEVIQNQFKELGIDLKLQQVEMATFFADTGQGNYKAAISGNTWFDAVIVTGMFHCMFKGTVNVSQVCDPELDPILIKIMTATNPEEYEKAAAEAQKAVLEKAYIVPLYAGQSYQALSNRVKGAVYSQHTLLELFDAYIETTVQ